MIGIFIKFCLFCANNIKISIKTTKKAFLLANICHNYPVTEWKTVLR